MIKFLYTNLCWVTTLLIFVAPVEVAAAPHPPAPMESGDPSLSESGETVNIDGTSYPVPKAWYKQKLNTPPLSTPALVRIPQELTENQASIYILQEACDALVVMAAKAKEDGISLLVDSGYRSARYQRKIFINLMAQGRDFEDLVRYIAPPGYSEHMLGTVVDFSPGNWRFADTPAYAWLHDHAEKYGFSESYPENNRHHPWESWHWRYQKTGMDGANRTD